MTETAKTSPIIDWHRACRDLDFAKTLPTDRPLAVLFGAGLMSRAPEMKILITPVAMDRPCELITGVSLHAFNEAIEWLSERGIAGAEMIWREARAEYDRHVNSRDSILLGDDVIEIIERERAAA